MESTLVPGDTSAVRHLPLLLLLAGSACVPQPVAWEETVALGEGALADTLRLALDEAGVPSLSGAWTPPTWPDEPAACVRTRRAVQAPDGAAYASWFSVRPDSSVVLRVARSDRGGQAWNAPVTADSTDVGTAGCARPVPFLAADALNGYVHLAYQLVGREGAGLFFTHSMERGALWHEPVPIVYGDRPTAATVASRGDTVVVVYEDPNSRLPRLGLAVSRTQGHIFEARTDVSADHGESTGPLVAVRGDRVAIVWTASQRGGRWPRIVRRVGTLTW